MANASRPKSPSATAKKTAAKAAAEVRGTRYARLMRYWPYQDWELNAICTNLESAWIGMKRMINEESENNPQFRCIVVTEESWLAGGPLVELEAPQ